MNLYNKIIFSWRPFWKRPMFSSNNSLTKHYKTYVSRYWVGVKSSVIIMVSGGRWLTPISNWAGIRLWLRLDLSLSTCVGGDWVYIITLHKQPLSNESHSCLGWDAINEVVLNGQSLLMGGMYKGKNNNFAKLFFLMKKLYILCRCTI